MAPHWNPEDKPGRAQILMIRDWLAVLLTVVHQFWSLRCWTVPFCPWHTHPTHKHSHPHIITATPMYTHCHHTQTHSHSILTHTAILYTQSYPQTLTVTPIPLTQSYPTVTSTHTFIPTFLHTVNSHTPNYIQTHSYCHIYTPHYHFTYILSQSYYLQTLLPTQLIKQVVTPVHNVIPTHSVTHPYTHTITPHTHKNTVNPSHCHSTPPPTQSHPYMQTIIPTLRLSIIGTHKLSNSVTHIHTHFNTSTLTH